MRRRTRRSEREAVRLLTDAMAVVDGPRNRDYGSPEENMRRIASLWQPYLDAISGRPLQPHDVVVLNVLQKVARLVETPSHRDSWMDIAGYAAIGPEVTS